MSNANFERGFYPLVIYQHVQSKNDVNGNPRRGWWVGEISIDDLLSGEKRWRNERFVTEGYAGFPSGLDGGFDLPQVSVPVSEWRAILKHHRQEGTLIER